MMKESEYILVSDLQKLRMITSILQEVMGGWACAENQEGLEVATKNLYKLMDEAFRNVKVDTSEEEDESDSE